MPTVHLCVMKLKGYGQGGPEPPLAVSAPHHHRITEFFGILVYYAVELGLYHSRCANNHIIFEERTLA